MNGTPSESILLQFDAEDEFDGWVAAWCIAQQRFKNLRDMFLRMNLDSDPDLNENDKARFRSLQFELTASFVRELRDLVLSRSPRHDQCLNDGPNEFVEELSNELDEMEQLLDQAVGDSDLASILREHRHRTFHLPINQKGKPKPKLTEALGRLTEHRNNAFEVSTDGSIGGTEVEFTRQIEAEMLAIELNIPENDPEGAILAERFTTVIQSVHNLVGRTDAVTMQLLRLQLVRKGLYAYDPDA